MNRWRWATGILGATTLLATGGWAHERGWVLADAPRAVAGPVPRAAVVTAPDEVERKARALRLTQDLGVAHRLLGECEGELASANAELFKTRSGSDDDRSELDDAVRTLRDLQRRYAPTDEVGPVLSKLVAWSGRTLEAMERDRDEARQTADREAGRADAAEEGLRREQATHERERSQSQAEVTALQDRLQMAATGLTELQSLVELARAQIDLDRQNNSLVVRNQGSESFIEWAIVFYRNSDGHVTARPISFTEDNNGYPLPVGATVNLGEGVAVVMRGEPAEDTGASIITWATRPVGSDGTIDVTWSW